MEATGSSEMSLFIYQNTHPHIAEYSNFNIHRCMIVRLRVSVVKPDVPTETCELNNK
jgi:hypothetical protein